MDTTVRNLDEATYRELKARAALDGKTVGEALNEAMRAYLAQPRPRKTRSILDWKPEDYGKANARLSQEIDEVAYGA